MARKIRYIVLCLILFLTALVLLVWLLYRFTPVVDTAVVKLLEIASGPDVQVSYSDLSGNLIGEVRLDDLEITTPTASLSVKKAMVHYNLLDVLNRRYLFNRIVLSGPKLTITVLPDTSRASMASEAKAVIPVPAPLDLSGVPVIVIRQLVIQDGRVFVVQKDDTVQTLKDIQVELKGELSEEKIELRPRYIRGFWENYHLRLQQLKFQLIGTRKRITVNQLEAFFEDSQLIGHGEVEFVPELKFYLFTDTSTINLSTLHAIFPSLPYRTGYVRLYGSFMGNFQEYSGELFLQALLDSLRIDRLSLRYKKKGRRYELEDIRVSSNVGRWHGSGILSPDSWNTVRLWFSRLNIRPLVNSPFSTRISGQLRLRFRHWSWRRMQGTADLVMHPVHLDTLRIDSVKFELAWDRGRFFLKEGSRIVVGPSSRFGIRGRVERQKRLDVWVESRNHRLEVLARRLNLPSLSGKGSLNLHFSGNLNNPDLEGRIFLDSLRYETVRLYGVRADVQIRSFLSHRLGRFALDVASGRWWELPITDARMRFRIQRNVVFLDSIQFVSRKNRVFASGLLSYAQQKWWFTLRQFQFRYRDYRLENRLPFRFVWGKDTLQVQQLALFTRGGGELSLQGRVAFHGSSDVVLKMRHIRLAALNQFWTPEYELDGKLNVTTRFQGHLRDPNFSFHAVVNDLSMDEQVFGDLTIRAGLQNRRFEIDRMTFSQNNGGRVEWYARLHLPEQGFSLQNVMAPSNRLEMRIQFQDFRVEDAGFFFKTNVPITGRIDGQIEIGRTMESPRGTYMIRVNDFRYGDYIFPYAELDGRIQPRKILLDFARVNFMHTEMRFNGWKAINWDPQNPGVVFASKGFGLLCRIQEDSLNFLSVIEPELDRITGDIYAFFKLGGAIDRPRLLEAEARLHNARVYLSKVANPITDVQLEAHLEDHYLVFDRLEGYASRTVNEQRFWNRIWRVITRPFQFLGLKEDRSGRITGEGKIDLSDLSRPGYQLRFTADQAYINYFIENARLVFSTDQLTVTGRDTIWVRGTVYADEGDVELDIAETEKNLLLSPTVREIPPLVAYDLDVRIPGNFFITNHAPFNTFMLEISGDLQIIQEPRAALEMNGYLEILKGKYFVQIEEFNIQEGRINFVNPKELPELHIVAQKRKYDLIFVLTVRGRLNNPVKEITIYDARDPSQPLPYPDVKDQMALLMFGVPFSELQSKVGSKLLEKGEEILTRTLISRIEKEARHFIGLDQIRIETTQSAALMEDARLNPAPATLALGKYLTPKLYFEYKSRLASTRIPGLMNIPTPQLRWEAGNQIYLEYRIGRNWSVSSFYEKTTEGNARIKFDISWQVNF